MYAGSLSVDKCKSHLERASPVCKGFYLEDFKETETLKNYDKGKIIRVYIAQYFVYFMYICVLDLPI